MTTEVLNPKEFGIEESQAKNIYGNLPQIKKERESLVSQFDEITKMDIEDPETSKEARNLRLRIRDNRTKGIAVWHKTTKDFFLKGGQFVDAIKRQEISVNERMEETLEEIEKYAEIKEQKRIEEVKNTRLKELEVYSEFVPFGIDLGNLSDEEYQKVFNGSKLQYEAKVEADKKAEAERLETERLNKLAEQRRYEIAPYAQFNNSNEDLRSISDKEYQKLFKSLKTAKTEYQQEQEKIRLENEKLKKEAEAKEKALQLERKKAKEESDKKEAQRQAELKAERDKQAKLQAELQSKKDAEAKAEREKIEAEAKAKKEAEELAKAPIKNQLNSWVDYFEIPLFTIEHEKAKEIVKKFDAFKAWAKKEIENI